MRRATAELLLAETSTRAQVFGGTSAKLREGESLAREIDWAEGVALANRVRTITGR